MRLGVIGVTLLIGFFYQSTLKPIFGADKSSNATALAGITYILVTGMFDATLYHLEHLIYLVIAVAYLISKKSHFRIQKK